ncbi:hypothetical protein [Nonomuraea roseoviolacea]|uniref:Uncharacterized protein n=1 Tax=Nonomuraea roseoviolacea subsp. carminata TaxID=160689 RepID=A0ABT1K9C2_9ACTN|nr:hypothetical protein [Nonomuraea roseoviolacea]MCP2350595.1 hypothetical protein [Nonomuraea roseoviolacea subsp. carminata]
MSLIHDLERVRGTGCVERMMALASELGLTAADVVHMPHQIAAEIAEGCIWYEDAHGLGHKRDWHEHFRYGADVATAAGLEGIVAYLLTQFWEESVAAILRRPDRTAHLTPEEVAQRTRLKLWADATFGRWVGGPATTSLRGWQQSLHVREPRPSPQRPGLSHVRSRSAHLRAGAAGHLAPAGRNGGHPGSARARLPIGRGL